MKLYGDMILKILTTGQLPLSLYDTQNSNHSSAPLTTFITYDILTDFFKQNLNVHHLRHHISPDTHLKWVLNKNEVITEIILEFPILIIIYV